MFLYIQTLAGKKVIKLSPDSKSLKKVETSCNDYS